MADISPAAQQSLVNALKQLTSQSATPLAQRQALPVLVSQLAGQQLQLTSGQQSVSLHKNGLQGKLQNGQRYQLRISSQPQNNLLQFFHAKHSLAAEQTQLSQQQRQDLAKLAASLLTPSAANPISPQGVSLNAVVVHKGTTQISLLLAGDTVKQQAIQLPLPASLRGVNVAEQVLLTIQSLDGKWLLSLQSANASGQIPLDNMDALNLLKLLANPQIRSQSAHQDQAIATLNKTTLQQWAQQSPQRENKNLGKQLQSSPLQAVPIQQLADNKVQLTLLKAEAQLPLSAQQLTALKPINIPMQTTAVAAQAESDSTVTLTYTHRQTAALPSPAPQLAQLPPSISAEALSQHLQTLMRQLPGQSESASQLLQQLTQLEQTLPQNMTAAQQQETVPLLKQITAAIPQGKETDASLIKQMLTSSAMPISPTQLLTSAANQGLLGGLISLLQISLAARMQRQQPAAAERLSQAIASLLPSRKGSEHASIGKEKGKGLKEWASLEQKHQLLDNIARMLGSHQGNKMANADAALQGQDIFYYTLPGWSSNGKGQDTELLLRREKEPATKGKQTQGKSKAWLLTMKLTIGNPGEMLAKARLQGNNLQMDFYTSSNELKALVLTYTPMLTTRLHSLGITVDKTSCQLGKIPESLQQRPYQLLETQA